MKENVIPKDLASLILKENKNGYIYIIYLI